MNYIFTSPETSWTIWYIFLYSISHVCVYFCLRDLEIISLTQIFDTIQQSSFMVQHILYLLDLSWFIGYLFNVLSWWICRMSWVTTIWYLFLCCLLLSKNCLIVTLTVILNTNFGKIESPCFLCVASTRPLQSNKAEHCVPQ